MVYVVIACHFRTKAELCETTLTRLRVALKMAKKESDEIFVTGDVPFMHGGPTLGELMRDWLIKNGFPKESVFVTYYGVGTFSEARVACEVLSGEEKATVISSNWYFFQGKPIWRQRGLENDINISFISASNTGGWRTFVTYAIIGIIVRAAIFIRFEQVLENFLTAFQERRREGFTFNGCK